MFPDRERQSLPLPASASAPGLAIPSLIPGLVGNTFRSLSPRRIISLAAQSGLQVIEWGGDIHVPHGDRARAKEVRLLTEAAGLRVAAYGSYYRAGVSETGGLPFGKVLRTALALGAPTVRVWLGAKSSADTPPRDRAAIVRDACRIARLAGAEDIAVSAEYHAGTLTDTRLSVQRLMLEISHPNLDYLWQPANGETRAQCAARLGDILPRLRNLHVFHWWPTSARPDRKPLAQGARRWRHYLQLAATARRPVACLLEFVRDDNPEQFLRDAATLRRWVHGVQVEEVQVGDGRD